MEFDEYDYLEKTVENSETPKSKERSNGGEKATKPEDKDRRSKHKTYKNDDERHSKRTKSGDEARDHDTEKGSSHHRSSPRDGDMSDRDRHMITREHRQKERERDKSKDKDREESNGKDKDRDKDKGVDRERGNGRERGERGREYEKERGKEKDREVRSRSRSERHMEERDREKGRHREKSRDREQRDKERERVKEREVRELDRETRRLKDKKEEAAEPVVDPERDQRTVFAYQISLKADERDVYEFFSRAGKVRDVRLIMDRNSRRSKGVGYIEFYESLSVPMAIALSGQPLLGQPVMVKPSEAEKNLVQSTASAVGIGGGLIGPYSVGARRLYVGNLHYNIKEDQLRQLFEPFGTVELVQLPSDPDTGHCKGYGFIQFSRLEDAKAAQSLNGQLEIAGRAIKVSAITDQAGMQDIGVNPGDFDDDEGGGMSLNARSRALLMQKLDHSCTATGIVGSVGTPSVNSPGLAVPTASILSATPGVSPIVAPLLHTIPALASLPAAALSVPTITVPSVESIGIPSECLFLKNMFDPKLEEEVNFDLDIKDDVQDECSKYGALKHIYVEKNSAGFVFLRFDSAQSAVAAQRALHGRWFAGKMITATFMLPQSYEAKFPDSS